MYAVGQVATYNTTCAYQQKPRQCVVNNVSCLSSLSKSAPVKLSQTTFKSKQCSRFRSQTLCMKSVFSATVDTENKKYPGEKKGFVEEMRFVAMRLHTKEQAPKEGAAEPKPEAKPMAQWQPTREGYLQFLTESKAVYEAMEDIMMSASDDSYKVFQNTGIERSEALNKDIAWFKDTYDMDPPELAADGSGRTYADLLQRLAVEDPPAFICHFYNVYFAHSAGGRMIGKKMSDTLLDGTELEFYKYGDSDLKELLTQVKDKLNTTAESWTREQKDHCLEETEASFKYSGQILRTIFGA